MVSDTAPLTPYTIGSITSEPIYLRFESTRRRIASSMRLM
jgi:hypothetical protein